MRSEKKCEGRRQRNKVEGTGGKGGIGQERVSTVLLFFCVFAASLKGLFFPCTPYSLLLLCVVVMHLIFTVHLLRRRALPYFLVWSQNDAEKTRIQSRGKVNKTKKNGAIVRAQRPLRSPTVANPWEISMKSWISTTPTRTIKKLKLSLISLVFLGENWVSWGNAEMVGQSKIGQRGGGGRGRRGEGGGGYMILTMQAYCLLSCMHTMVCM